MLYEKYLPKTEIPFDPKHFAREIIARHTEGYLQGIHAEYPDNHAMMDDMYSECAFILSTDLLEGKLTPMQYAAVRNELGPIIWDLFKESIEAEDKKEMVAFLASLSLG